MGRRITVPSAGNQTGQSHADASLPHHLLMHIQRGFIPALTLGTPALVDPMVCDLHRLGHINHLAAACQADASTQLTRRTRDQPMLHNLHWLRAWSGSIMPRISLLARLLLFLWPFLLLRLNERWWRCFQLLQFLNACLGNSQLLSDFFEPL